MCGIKESAFKKLNFPYKAYSISQGGDKMYKGMDDVYEEFIQVYDISIERGLCIGKSLYDSKKYFSDDSQIIDQDCQNRINEYRYCKTFSCSPYPSMYETPTKIVDDFIIISEECDNFVKEKNKENNKDA